LRSSKLIIFSYSVAVGGFHWYSPVCLLILRRPFSQSWGVWKHLWWRRWQHQTCLCAQKPHLDKCWCRRYFFFLLREAAIHNSLSVYGQSTHLWMPDPVNILHQNWWLITNVPVCIKTFISIFGKTASAVGTVVWLIS